MVLWPGTYGAGLVRCVSVREDTTQLVVKVLSE